MSTVCVDVGCATYQNENSIERLLARFHPDRLYGLDPLVERVAARIGGTQVTLLPVVAWTYAGMVNFHREGSRSRVADVAGEVPCIDLAAFITELDADEIVLKLDVEGSEYALLPHLHRTGADGRLSLAWVEWHPQFDPDRVIEQRVRAEFACPIEDWTF